MKIQSVTGKVWLALSARLDEWTETPVYLPDTVFKPTADQAYLIIDPAYLDADIESIDYQCGEENRGFLNVRVMTPLTWNYAAALGLMGRVADMFPAGLKLSYMEADVEIWQHPRPNSSPVLEASWNRQDLRIDWRCWG